MATTRAIHKRSRHLAHYLTIVAIALALVLGTLVVDGAASTGLLANTVGLETATFHLIAKHTPFKFVSPPPKGNGDVRRR